MKTKATTVRLPIELLEEIDIICDVYGCSRNDWIKDALKEKLSEESSQEEAIPKEDLKILVEDIPDNEPQELTNVRVVDI